MNNCKISIINSIIAGILICAMLAAFGVAEKQKGFIKEAAGFSVIADAQPSEPEVI